MRKTKYTSKEIEAAKAAARLKHEQVYTLEWAVRSFPRANVKPKPLPATCSMYVEYSSYQEIPIDELIGLLQRQKEFGVTQVHFTGYGSDGGSADDITMHFSSAELETDEQYKTRLDALRKNTVENKAAEDVKHMLIHNRRVQEYLDLKKTFGD